MIVIKIDRKCNLMVKPNYAEKADDSDWVLKTVQRILLLALLI